MLEKMSDNIPDEIKLPTGSKLVLSSSPHVSASESLRKIMLKAEPALGIARVRQCLYGIQQTLSAQGLLQAVMLHSDVDPY